MSTSLEAWLTVTVPVTKALDAKLDMIALREMQFALRQSETTKDRADISGDPTYTCNNCHDRTSNDIFIYIGTRDAQISGTDAITQSK